MSSSPIEYRSFTKILLCCNIAALSASSLQKKKKKKKLCVKHRTLMKRLWKEEESNWLTLISRDKNYLHSISVQLYGIYNSRLYVGIGHTPFQPATQDNYTKNE